MTLLIRPVCLEDCATTSRLGRHASRVAAVADAHKRRQAPAAEAAAEVSWTDHVAVDDVVERLASHSQHRLLDPSTSTAINEALRNELGVPTDVLALSYTTLIFTAARQ